MKSCKFLILLFSLLLISNSNIRAQVILRDSTLNWRHHRFELNDNFSMKTYSTNDNDIENVFFNAKVIENELIKLVIVPEYGARVISFVDKSTGHECLYQSECGSPYGINEGNFYYNWLMVYGGIFPTFPEPEHGKTWFLPWDYTVLKNTSDTVSILMEYTDNSAFAYAPGSFNNGISNITCQVEISVYRSSSLWDFKINLINNKNQIVNYEYWTCTTLTPGSEVGNTGSPLNSEMIAPIEQYKAAWSPNSWIGNNGNLYDFEEINFLNDWTDMGIAYAVDLNRNYWGVINHENQEGIFRISENIETPGMKFWTWGRNNVDNNLFDFSNGGQDNYIELWAGTSHAFFEDDKLQAYQEKSWVESYVPTQNLSGIVDMNREFAVNIAYNGSQTNILFELNKFNMSKNYTVWLNLVGEMDYLLLDTEYTAHELNVTESIATSDLKIPYGEYLAKLEIVDSDNKMLMVTEQTLIIQNQTSIANLNSNEINIRNIGGNQIQINLPNDDHYELYLSNVLGQVIKHVSFNGDQIILSTPQKGMYLINISGNNVLFKEKIWIN